MEGMQTREELRSSLLEYEEQLRTVRALLADDPENAEYAELQTTLEEMTAMTRDLLEDDEEDGGRGGNAGAAPAAPAAAPGSAALGAADGPGPSGAGAGPARDAPRPVRVSRDDWKVGDVCEARYSGDGQWYRATVVGLIHDPVAGPVSGGAAGYEVNFSDYGNREDVGAEDIRDPVIVKVRPRGRDVVVDVRTPRHTGDRRDAPSVR